MQKNGTELEFPYYYYPGYEIILKTENEEIQLKGQESEHGYLSCILPQEVQNGELKVSYKGTIITHFSYIASGIFAIIFIGYIAYEKSRKFKLQYFRSIGGNQVND